MSRALDFSDVSSAEELIERELELISGEVEEGEQGRSRRPLLTTQKMALRADETLLYSVSKGISARPSRMPGTVF